MSEVHPPDVSHGTAVLAVQWTTGALAIALTLLRVYIRGFVRHNLGWDDYMIWIATALAAFASTYETFNVHYGIGRHEIYVKKNLPEVIKISRILALENGLATAFVKISVCIFILRMIGRTQKSVRYAVYVNLAFLIPFTIAVTFLQGFQCIPFDKLWHPTKPGKCLNTTTVGAVAKAYSSVGVVTDFLTVAIPVAVVSKLQVSRAKKIALVSLLTLGFFTAGCAIAKTVVLEYSTEDITWNTVPVIVWSALEHQLGIIIADIPAVQPAYHYVESKISSAYWSLRSTRGKGSGNALSSGRYGRAGYQKSDSEDAVHLQGMNIKKTTDIDVEADHEGKQEPRIPSFV